MSMRIFRAAALAVLMSLAGLAGPAGAEHSAMGPGKRLYTEGDYEGAFLQFELAAEDGDPQGQWYTGNMYLAGEGIAAADAAEAARFYELAAGQGYAEAMISLAALYRTGRGVEKDMGKAIDWLYRAAALDHPIAMFDLAEIFSSDADGVSRSDSFAFDWYRLAARQGIVLAQLKTGQMLINGIGTEADQLKGMVWLTVARLQAEAAKDKELLMSYRAFPLDAPVATDAEGKTLRQLTIEIYDTYARTLPASTVDDAERMVPAMDPASF